jgi:membrane-associated protease RseP (regulator of RpoE activity)
MLIMIFFIVLLVGCATTGSIQTDTGKLQKLDDVKTVSVLTFTCSDPGIAHNVRNMIIESLLTHYSVATGGEADVVINGTITLSNDPVSTASAGQAADYVSGISAQIIKNNKILTSSAVTQVVTDSSTPDSPDVMGRKIGTKIKEILSN